jgi:hypothetical protein
MIDDYVKDLFFLSFNRNTVYHLGTNELNTSFDTSTSVEDESLNTPSIFPSSALNTPTPLKG